MPFVTTNRLRFSARCLYSERLIPVRDEAGRTIQLGSKKRGGIDVVQRNGRDRLSEILHGLNMSNIEFETARDSLKIVLPEHLKYLLKEVEFSETALDDRRCETRLRFAAKAAIDVESSPDGFENIDRHSMALVRDISRRGIGFLWHCPLAPNSVVFLRFQARQIRATVVRCSALGPSCFDFGATMLYFKSLESG